MKKRFVLVFIVFLLTLMAPQTVLAKTGGSKAKVYLARGKTTRLASRLKIKKTAKAIRWKSSKPSVATVTRYGTVKGIKAGKAIITARTGEKNYRFRVTVLSLNKTSVELKKGRSFRLKVKNGRRIKWTSSKPEVASVKNGRIRAKAPGKTIITAKSHDVKLKCVVKVHKVVFQRSVLTESGILSKLRIQTAYFKKKPEFSSSNEEVAMVTEKGTITAKGPGVATIIVRGDGFHYKKRIQVVSGIPGYFMIVKGEKRKINVTGNSSRVFWESSNSSIADVKNGNVTAKRPGTCKIRVKIKDTTMNCMVTVINSAKDSDVFLGYMDKYCTYVKEHGKYFSRTMDYSLTYARAKARISKKKKAGLRCFVPILWATTEMKMNPVRLYCVNGSFRQKYRSSHKEHVTWIKKGSAVGKTVKQAKDAGLLRPGDIICFRKLTHTFVYSGKGYYMYDGGQAASMRGYRKVGTLVDYSEVGYYKNRKIAEILRWNDQVD